MAFKKRDYKAWYKFYNQMVFENGCNPYLLKNEFIPDLVNDNDFEGAKAAKDIFDLWYSKYGMSEKETNDHLTNFYKNHPVYGQTK